MLQKSEARNSWLYFCEILADFYNFFSLLAYVATLPCETLKNARKQAINDKLQGSIGTYLKSGGVVNNQIKKGLLVSLSVKKNKINEYLAKLQAIRWLSRALCAPGHHTAKRR